MGWKTSFIIIAHEDCPNGYLGTLPEHDPERSDKLASLLGYKLSNPQPSNLDFCPPGDTVMIGAFDKAAIIVDQEIYDCFPNRTHPLFQRSLQVYPEGIVLLLVLHSVVNLFGYALYERGTLIRELGGNIDDDVTSEFGEPLPEERSEFLRSEIRDGARIFFADIGGRHPRRVEFSTNAFGSTLAFLVASRFFGERLDKSSHKTNHNLLVVESFQKYLWSN